MTCVMCGRRLPPDRRWAWVRWLNPRPPMCTPPSVECLQEFRARLDLPPLTDREAQDLVDRAYHSRGLKPRGS